MAITKVYRYGEACVQSKKEMSKRNDFAEIVHFMLWLEELHPAAQLWSKQFFKNLQIKHMILL